MQNTVQLPQDLYDAVRKKAAAQAKTTEALIVEWVAQHLDESETSEINQAFEQEITAFEREVAAFKALKPELLKQYPGQYVAVYQGQVVGSGDNRLALVKEVYSQFGEVPCYVEIVSLEQPRRVRIPSVWKVK